ncbi:hypothetical protein GGI02_000394 [Coemansia sp. RSA 2322]|nr:hypothetical protein GGI02_000394 [Coemansia sp. RSA 2322]KAJ2486927.1 hypothetical protein EV174_000827 [Coemansia sp. RSA 2320]
MVSRGNITDIIPSGDPEKQCDGQLYIQAMERKREKNKIAARVKRMRKKQRMEALERREQELRERRMQLENELRSSWLASSKGKGEENSRKRPSEHRNSGDGDNSSDDNGGSSSSSGENSADERRAATTLQTMCDEVRAVCEQAQSAIDTLTGLRRELSSLLKELD